MNSRDNRLYLAILVGLIIFCVWMISCNRITVFPSAKASPPEPVYGVLPNSVVRKMDDNTYVFGLEAHFPPGKLSHYEWDFKDGDGNEVLIPPGRRLLKLQGTMSFRCKCFGQPMAVMQIDNSDGWRANLKSDGWAQNIFIDYDIPQPPTTSGKGKLVIEADPELMSYEVGWEFQGMFQTD